MRFVGLLLSSLILTLIGGGLVQPTTYAAFPQTTLAGSSGNESSRHPANDRLSDDRPSDHRLQDHQQDDQQPDTKSIAPAGGELQKESTQSDEQTAPLRASDRNHLHGRAGWSPANRSKLPASRKPSVPVNTANFHQPNSHKSGGSATRGFVRSETVNRAQRARSTGAARPTVASLTSGMNPALNPSTANLRHRGPNPAIVGGAATGSAGRSANFNSSNPGAIDGTRIHRNP